MNPTPSSTCLDRIGAPAGTFKDAMRRMAASVTIITSRDVDGKAHGMAASSAISVSMDPPSMLIAVNRTAGLHPVVLRSGRFCVNLLGDHQQAEVLPFSRSALRDQRFASADWNDVAADDPERLPWLHGATASIDCHVDSTIDYGTHTVFIGRVCSVRCDADTIEPPSPLVWLAGEPASLVRNG